MPDKWEKRHHLNVKKDDSRRDRDRDGLSNYGEYRAHTNPRKKDSDHDGRRDSREDFDRDHLRNAAEIKTGYDPRDKDSDNDGVKDGRENAGKIVALSGSTVTIKLAVGGKLAAALGDGLAIRCAPGADSGSGSTPDESTPELGDGDAPVPGEDDDSGDLPDGETADDSVVGDVGGPDDGALPARASGEDDDDGMDGLRRHRVRRRRPVRHLDAEARRHRAQGEGHPHRLGTDGRVAEAPRPPQEVAQDAIRRR
jgi:hypothetical protein